MLPTSDERQFVVRSSIDVEPLSSSHHFTDYWGTQVVAFDVLAAHRELAITATSLVEVRDATTTGVHTGSEWDSLVTAAAHSGTCAEHLRYTSLTTPPESLAQRAAQVSGSGNPCETALTIANAVRDEMTYESGVTGVRTTAAQAWQNKTGVCQDIAHVVIGALRATGIPARYVSGYLHPQKEPAIGDTVIGESHAWVEWYCGQWHGYDPTNRIPIGDRHVRVGHGRDYNDVTPLRGIYAGPAESELFVSVSITREG